MPFFKGVYYYCYEAVKAVFEKAKGQGKPMSTGESMLAGALAGSAVVLATHPIWTVNVSPKKKGLLAKEEKKAKIATIDPYHRPQGG